ncbi:hypothetical protein L226DRAFT_566250 [Lentinus tigrinus ALCF2SS1-7]|uniref:Arrestin-like N-terminal domain-containing protein n=1 Tax=Lentinus tigrinus ALCF2SS1-6 TaxID=1328759 RepID=A0A5C2SWK9_9APHY|nr:hypothetical protein L227DRAFT_491195 [Lentinus tigrinus ALCF2SS1-6]RPD81488.1 hypothetical protein L226DRAFT_566250 [Lentinus tigrinus ALCF2SS1-7]
MFSRLTSSSALTVYIPPAIYAAGSTIDGEVQIQFRDLQDENIEEVQLRLRGTSKTFINRDRSSMWENIRLARVDSTLWSKGAAYPPAGSDVLRVPFSVPLPEQLPPSFHMHVFAAKGDIRYSLSAVGVRKGLLNLNRRHVVPLAVLPRDELGAQLKAEHATHGWKAFQKEDRIRKGFWGDYSKVHVELSLPSIPVLPLFSDIPFTIRITTTTPPASRSKADASPSDKPLFPPVPLLPNGIQFSLLRKVRLRAKMFTDRSSKDVAVFLGEKKSGQPYGCAGPVETVPPVKEWVEVGSALVQDEKAKEEGKEAGSDAKGSWVQRAVFHSTFRLDCPPTFAVHNIECSHQLVVKVPFPGIGNDLKLEVPVTVTSGIDKPLPRDSQSVSKDGEPAQPPPNLDLPPAYWDASDQDWAGDEKD